MIEQVISSFSFGVGAGLAVGSPVEWIIHRDMLHARKKAPSGNPIRKFLEKYQQKARLAHNDKHHGAHIGPEHYYRDVTNEDEVMHFGLGDVGVIFGASALAGTALNRAGDFLYGNSAFGGSDAAFAGGFVTGAMAYYACYEFSHHYMHVIGSRRSAINRVFGDTLQNQEPDGKLRFSKPLLDDLCNEVERKIDTYVSDENCSGRFDFEDDLLSRVERQTSQNKDIILNERPILEILDETGQILLKRERQIREVLSFGERVLYWIERNIQSQLRNSYLFQEIDNHHFLHHYMYGKNLNVVFPLMDILKRTKVDSSKKKLDENKRYWLCPNSPDTVPFLLSQTEIL